MIIEMKFEAIPLETCQLDATYHCTCNCFDPTRATGQTQMPTHTHNPLTISPNVKRLHFHYHQRLPHPLTIFPDQFNSNIHLATLQNQHEKPENWKTRAQVATVKGDCGCSLVAVFRPAINGGKYTKCFITHTPHVPARNRDRASFRTRQMCPQCKQNAHVNYTGQQEPRNKRTLTTKANRSLWLRVFVFLCELKMTHFESKRSKIETHTIKRRKIKKSASELTFKRETTGKQKP